MIAVIDYKAGNLGSVGNALRFLGQEYVITSDSETIRQANKVILPGVGAFGDAMKKLTSLDLDGCIKSFCLSGKPFLDICLGLQLLFDSSEESPGISGLGIFSGKIKRIPCGSGLKIPHIGWNSLEFVQSDGLFRGTAPNTYVYFVHSYYALPQNDDIVSAFTHYGKRLPIAFSFNNIHLVQFHPEKSGDAGLRILTNFIKL